MCNLTDQKIDFYDNTSKRIAKALEKIAEKDFGNKTIHAHRIAALQIIEKTAELVEEYIETEEERCSLSIKEKNSIRETEIRGFVYSLQNILDCLKL